MWSRTAIAKMKQDYQRYLQLSQPASRGGCAPVVGYAIAANHGVKDDLLCHRVQELIIIDFHDVGIVARWG